MDIGKILIDMGITPDLEGFHWILRVLPFSGEMKLESAYLQASIKYPGKSVPQIKRVIGFAVQKADQDSEAYKNYIGALQHPTNSSFLASLKYNTKRKEENNDPN